MEKRTAQRLSPRERQDVEDGMRRAVARLTYEAEWEWFLKRRSCDILKRCIEHSRSRNDICYGIGINNSSFTTNVRGTSKLKPERYLKVIGYVYPEYKKLIAAELRDIERLED
ncbi:MAG: hypothetical protein CMH52_14335 [Myxococcales bacterium]|nr:hypothetical protein [Myxococcales bacterium]|tara:strand:+ start:506 stop:844 length:339 start_codon:yes stop_codon:yes gene_type:complete